MEGGQVDGGPVSGSYEKHAASKCALFLERHCDMQLRSAIRGLRVRFSMRVSCILTEGLLWDLRFWRLRSLTFWIFWQGAVWNVVDRFQRMGRTRCSLLQDRSYNMKNFSDWKPVGRRILSGRCGREVTLGTVAKLNPDSPVVHLVGALTEKFYVLLLWYCWNSLFQITWAMLRLQNTCHSMLETMIRSNVFATCQELTQLYSLFKKYKLHVTLKVL